MADESSINSYPAVSVGIIDLGLCNIASVANATQALGANVSTITGADQIVRSDKLILPGVGTYKEGMARLHELDLIKTLDCEVLEKKKPLLGICLGMQLLASEGTEKGYCKGLGYIPGKVEMLSGSIRLPHMGWNGVSISKHTPLYSPHLDNLDYYFIHSYAINCPEDKYVAGTTDYGDKFVSMVNMENIFGVQFHPEKSHRAGLHMLHRFLYLEYNPSDACSFEAVDKVLKNAVSNDRKVHSWTPR